MSSCRGHRLVLGSRSDYFRALLDHAAAEAAAAGVSGTASEPATAINSENVRLRQEGTLTPAFRQVSDHPHVERSGVEQLESRKRGSPAWPTSQSGPSS